MDVSDWLWQGVATNLIGDALIASGLLAWKYRAAIARTLARQPIVKRSAVHIRSTSSMTAKPTVVQVSAASGGSGGSLTTVSAERTASWDVLASVGTERTALWNVQAPTRPQLKRIADELLELGLWYLRQS